MSEIKKLWAFCAIFLAAFLIQSTCAQAAPLLNFRVVQTFPHDPAHFTQGLLLHEGRLYESAGGYGVSALYEKDLRSGKTLRARKLARSIFGEGLALLDERLYQISWRNQRGAVYDLQLKPLREFEYQGEGWGLTDDGHSLLMSNGSSHLSWRDAETFAERRNVQVRDGAAPVTLLNELEHARGLIFANVWMSNRIAVIAPDSGAVRAWLDLSSLLERFDKPAGWNAAEHVLNGIAYDEAHDRFYVTGKCWPVLFELDISPLAD